MVSLFGPAVAPRSTRVLVARRYRSAVATPRVTAAYNASVVSCGKIRRSPDSDDAFGGDPLRINVTVNGTEHESDVEPRLLLVHYLRETLGLTGTNIGCDTSSCGACTVHVDGESVKSCTMLAAQADGAEITTIEGLANGGELHPMQEAFRQNHGLQCGYCTPGMVMAAVSLLKENPHPTETEVRYGLEGNLCRCTGYHNIVKAVLAAAEAGARHDGPADGPPLASARAASRWRRRSLHDDSNRHATDTGHRHADAPQGGPARCSPARRSSPTTSPSPARSTWPSCAARTPTPASAASTPPRRGRMPGVVAVYTGADLARPLGRPDAVRLAGHRRHEEPAALPGHHRQGALRRRRRGRRGRPVERRGPRRGRRHRRRLRTARARRSTSRTPLRDRVLVHDDLGTNTSYVWELDIDPDGAVAEGLRHRRLHGEGALRPAAPHPDGDGAASLSPPCPQPFGGEITLYSATQIPHILKIMVAITLGIPEHQLRVVAPSVGGGFGSKLNVYAEELLCTALARKHGVPVRWVEERTENALATIQGRGQIQDIELAADADGKLTAVRVRLLADMGAYLQLVTPGIPLLGAFLYGGVYDLPQAYSFTCTSVFTTMTPTDAYRGAGRPEATYAIERAMDALAAEIGIDPLELRARNFIKTESFPYTAMTRARRTTRATTSARPTKAAPGRLRRRAGRAGPRRAAGSTKHLGVGVSSLLRDVRPGAVPGAGLAELRRRRLGTGHGPRPAHQQGPGGHRGHAPRPGPRDVLVDDRRRQARGVTRRRRRAPLRHRHQPARPRHLRLAVARRRRRRHRHGLRQGDRQGPGDRRPPAGGGRGRPRVRRRHVQRVRARRSRRCRLAAIAFEAFTAHNLPDGMEPNLEAHVTYDPPNFSWPFGTHMCVVEVDTETGCGRGAEVRRRRRLRDAGQPADRRRPGARRRRPGPGPGAVRGGRLRRRRQPPHVHPGRLPRAGGLRCAGHHHRPHRHALAHEPAWA